MTRYLRLKRFALLVLVGSISATLWAQAQAPMPAAGLAPERIAVIDRALQRYVDDNAGAGMVALALRDGRPVYEKAFGWSDKEAGQRMTTDTLFRIASQTKALTSVAVMQLVEEGKLTLSTRVGTLIPTFASTTVAESDSKGGVRTVPAKRAITVRDLLTHTAGISYGTDPSVAADDRPY